MFNFLRKIFIKNYEDTSNPKVREDYGTFCSFYSIICNIIMVIIKLLISFITNSVSIRADAFNNLSDVGSNIATLFGFKLASKHPDTDHPYGHGRYEYLSGLFISILIIIMGFESIKESVNKIINKGQMSFTFSAIIILVISIIMKLSMWLINKKSADLIDSDTLNAAAQDSLSDSIMTFTTVISLIFFKLTNFNIDAYIGFIVSVLVIKSGFEILMDVLDTILGKAPDADLIKEIEKTVLSDKEFLGLHDLMLHDYGASSKFMSFHVEVDASHDVIDIHDKVDNMEERILKEFGILTTIHMDPVEINDPMYNELKEVVGRVVKEVNAKYLFHDFRFVKGPTHTNLVFDLLIPSEDKSDHEEIRKQVANRIKEINPTYNAVIKVEHSFVD